MKHRSLAHRGLQLSRLHRERPRRDPFYGDRGVETVEWGAALLLIAVILGVLIGPALLPQSVGDNIAYAICRVFNPTGDCELPADARFKPKACAVSTSVDSYGGKVEVAIFDVGRDITFIRTTDSNGKVTVTAVNGHSVGVGTGVGAGVNIKNAVNIGADASVHGGLKVGIGDSWEFGSPEEADKFIGEIQKKAKQDAVKQSGVLGFVGGNIWGAVDPPEVRDADIDRYEVELGGNAGVGTGIGFGPANNKAPTNRRERADRRTDGDQPGVDINPNLNAYASVDGAEKAIVESNNRTGEKSVTVQVAGTAKAGERHVVDGNQVRGEARGAVKLTYDKNGNLSKLTLTRTGIVNDKAEITTTELDITSDEERAAVYEHLFADQAPLLAGNVPVAGTPLRLTLDDMTPDTPPGPGATPLQQLLYDKGKSAKVNYDYDVDESNYSANVKFGLKLGLGVDISHVNQKATGGQYLGAPGPDGRQWRNFQECAR